MGGWIKRSERMPVHGDDVLVFCLGGYMYTAKYNSASLMFTCDDEGVVSCVDVTHWQPLPEPPQE